MRHVDMLIVRRRVPRQTGGICRQKLKDSVHKYDYEHDYEHEYDYDCADSCSYLVIEMICENPGFS